MSLIIAKEQKILLHNSSTLTEANGRKCYAFQRMSNRKVREVD